MVHIPSLSKSWLPPCTRGGMVLFTAPLSSKGAAHGNWWTLCSLRKCGYSNIKMEAEKKLCFPSQQRLGQLRSQGERTNRRRGPLKLSKVGRAGNNPFDDVAERGDYGQWTCLMEIFFFVSLLLSMKTSATSPVLIHVFGAHGFILGEQKWVFEFCFKMVMHNSWALNSTWKAATGKPVELEAQCMSSALEVHLNTRG